MEAGRLAASPFSGAVRAALPDAKGMEDETPQSQPTEGDEDRESSEERPTLPSRGDRPVGSRGTVIKFPGVDVSAFFAGISKQLQVRPNRPLFDFQDYARQATKGINETLTRIASSFPDDWESPNWKGDAFHRDGILDLDMFEIADDVMKAEGIPLAYVPRAEVLNELLLAPNDDTRRAILIDRRPEIVKDRAQVLDEVTDPRLQPLREQCGKALDALRYELDEPAQSHAANVFDRILRDIMRNGVLEPESVDKYIHHERAAKYLKRRAVHDDIAIDEFRVGCVVTPTILALKEYAPGRTPIPRTFNRHATAHAAHSTMQFTPANALIAVMLTTSLLRESQASGW
jgi:hypothetical protein